jgi:thiamine biosynthesis lipoprotein
VTVVAPHGLTAEGLSKVVGVLGREKGLKLVEQTPGAAALVFRAPLGKVERYESQRWKELTIVEVKGQ